MDRRDFFLKVAKASGVVIPSWGLLPLAAYGQQTAAPKILVYVHFDGGPVADYFGDPSAEPTLQPVYAGRAWRFPGVAICAGRRSATTRSFSTDSVIRS